MASGQELGRWCPELRLWSFWRGSWLVFTGAAGLAAPRVQAKVSSSFKRPLGLVMDSQGRLRQRGREACWALVQHPPRSPAPQHTMGSQKTGGAFVGLAQPPFLPRRLCLGVGGRPLPIPPTCPHPDSRGSQPAEALLPPGAARGIHVAGLPPPPGGSST